MTRSQALPTSSKVDARHGRIRARVRQFLRREDGSLIVFGLVLFTLMLMMGGMAVDLMRYEQRRTALQQTIDRSVLAAASLTQDRDPEAVVNDYFDKAELSQYLRSVTVTEGMNFRIVEADAEAELLPYFTPMVGIDEFFVPAASAAEQRINNVEIVLVLDVSGSMNEPTGGTTKIAALRAAAAEFVQTVKTNDVENRISIAIVPYNAQVNLGPVLRGKYNATHVHDIADANCLELPQSAFNTPIISRTTAIPMMAQADTTSSTTRNTTYYAPTDTSNATPNSFFCRTLAANLVRFPSGNVAELQSIINGLTAGGNTSITLGMKWALQLIDPASQPLFNELISEGHMSPDFAGRPFAYDDEDMMKVIVVMTDGDHVAHTRINDAYKTGVSPIYYNPADGRYSIQHTSRASPNWYTPHNNSWSTGPWGGTSAVQQRWQDVWARNRLTWVAWQLYARPLGGSDSTARTNHYNTWMNNFRSTWASDTQMDATMQQSCTQAKQQGVIIYGIAFEAPPIGTTQILNCSTSPAHFFNAQGLEIQSAFRAIASNISMLRLTQ
jgi:Flp pilus assembly protein TadG